MPGLMPDFFNIMFIFIPVIFGAVVMIIFGRNFFKIFKVASDNSSNTSPRIPANARIVSKRIDHRNGRLDNYCVEFQFDTGDRRFFITNRDFFDTAMENDEGILITRGDIFISFDNQNYATYKYPPNPPNYEERYY